MCTHLCVRQFVLAVEVGRRRIDDDEVHTVQPLHFGFDPCSHGFDAEGAGNERNPSLVVAIQILVAKNAHAEIIGILAREIDDLSFFCCMPAKGGLRIAATDEPRNQQGKGGLAMAGLRGQRVDKATLQDTVEQIVRRNKTREKISHGHNQVCRYIS